MLRAPGAFGEPGLWGTGWTWLSCSPYSHRTGWLLQRDRWEPLTLGSWVRGGPPQPPPRPPLVGRLARSDLLQQRHPHKDLLSALHPTFQVRGTPRNVPGASVHTSEYMLALTFVPKLFAHVPQENDIPSL